MFQSNKHSAYIVQRRYFYVQTIYDL